jgi:hypothetical protein
MGKLVGIDSSDPPGFQTKKYSQKFVITREINAGFHKNGNKGANLWQSF